MGANHQFKVDGHRERALFPDSNGCLEELGSNAPSNLRQPPGWRIFTIAASLQPDAPSGPWERLGVYGEDVLRYLESVHTVGVRIEQEQLSAPGFKPFDPCRTDAFVTALNNEQNPRTSSSRTVATTFTAFEDISEPLQPSSRNSPASNSVGSTVRRKRTGPPSGSRTTSTLTPTSPSHFAGLGSVERRQDEVLILRRAVLRQDLPRRRHRRPEPVLANFDAQSDRLRPVRPSFAY